MSSAGSASSADEGPGTCSADTGSEQSSGSDRSGWSEDDLGA